MEVVCFEFDNWSYQFNQQIKEEFNKATLHIIHGGRKPFIPWAVSVFLESALRLLGRMIPLHGWMLSQAVTRRTILLMRKIERIEGNFDLIIGHNPGALYPTYIAGKRFQCRTGFDVEDYHPGEGDNKNNQRLTRLLMNEYLPEMDYVTFAAPLMKERHIDDLGFEKKDWEVILNLFNGEQFSYVESKNDDALHLVWFSQNVNFKRGLEQFIPAIKDFHGKIQLTLIGNKKETFFSEFVEGNEFIKYLPPIEQSELNKCVCEFDVGLAIEQGKDYNNVIALSNKLITYYQAGLFVLASDTPAQQQFFSEFPLHGIAVPLQEDQVHTALQKLLNQKEEIRSAKRSRFDAAGRHSWETESEKLLRIWNAS